jgi:hypothetical protein
MRCRLAIFLAALGCAALLAACGAPSATGPQESVLDQAAAEATAIIQQAQGTALILQAQAQASAVVALAQAQAAAPPATVTPALPAGAGGDAAGRLEPTAVAAAAGEAGAGKEVTGTVEIVGVGFGADGGLIIVQFTAPPREAQTWWQGSVYVEDEATGARYTEIPVMPVVGPLIGRPIRAGQLGYVMLVNSPVPLASGAVVTVVLGKNRFEHVPVQ